MFTTVFPVMCDSQGSDALDDLTHCAITIHPVLSTRRTIMGEKSRPAKSKGKSPKAPKAGALRPHEQRQKDAAYKSADVPSKPFSDGKS
jgi:hypothetical protein